MDPSLRPDYPSAPAKKMAGHKVMPLAQVAQGDIGTAFRMTSKWAV